MSDSEDESVSSHDSASASEAEEAPESQHEHGAKDTTDTADDAAQVNNGSPETENPDDKPPAEPPSLPSSDGMHVMWSDSDDNPELLAFDFVVVPGAYGNGARSNESWASPGSGTSQWVLDSAGSLASTSGSRILRFEYPSRHLFSGRRSREAIRSCALKLLGGLKALRKDETRKRAIMFISHDLGGTVVKDALVTAALEPTAWRDIVDLTRVVVFHGSPHRTTSALDMEDRLCRFFFSDYDDHISEFRPSASSVTSLATAVTEVNGLFIMSKVPLRARLVSIHATPTWAKLGISQVFDNYCATFGLPLEKRIAEAEGGQYPDLIDHLTASVKALTLKYDDNILDFERTLLSLASPMPPLQTAMVSAAALTQTPEYIAWRETKGPQILYLHGSFDIRSTAEKLFYALDNEANASPAPRTAVLFFSFDRWDVRFDSMRDVASTFITQLVCQYPILTESAPVQRMLARLTKERCWTEQDLLYWFDMVWSSDELDNVICVFNHFDECVKGSRTAFFQRFSHLAGASELTRKLVITSHAHGSLLGELKDYPHTSLDLSDGTNPTTEYPMGLPPEALPEEDVVRKQWEDSSALDPLVRSILWEQAKRRRDWPCTTPLSDLFGPLDASVTEEGDSNGLLTILLDRVFQAAAQPEIVERMLLWLLYAVRPLTVAELASALETGADGADPSLRAINDTKHQIDTCLAGIFEIDHGEIKITHPRLRDVMMSPSHDAGEQHVWDRIAKSADFEIATRCLDYLSQPKVQQLVAECYPPSRSGFASDGGNICSYALQAWTHHFSHVTPGDGRTKLKQRLTSLSNLASSLATGHWVLSNRIMRSPQPPATLFPVFASLEASVLDVVSPDPSGKPSALGAMKEAAANGRGDAVDGILEDFEFSEAELLETLVAASTSGNENLLLRLVDLIIKQSADGDKVPWPSSVLYRASWLGLARFLDKLLTLGCPVEPEAPWQSTVPTSMLLDAVRNNHEAAVRVLVKHGANVAFRTVHDRSVLHVAGYLGLWNIIDLIITDGKPDLDIKDSLAYTPIYWACVFGHHKATEVLLKAGADPMMGSPSGSWNPLLAAADGGLERCVELLLQNGAKPNVPGPQGTPLRYAAVNGHVNICRLLLDAKADPNNPEDKTPILSQVIDTATKDKMLLDVFTLLVERGANVNAKVDSKSVLMFAASHDQGATFVRILLDQGADVSCVHEDGTNVLHFATLGEPATTELLLERGADANRLANDDQTPVYRAYSKDDIGHLRALLEHGADPDLGKPSGFTALMAAAFFGRLDRVELLLKHKAAIDLPHSNGNENVAGWTALVCALTQEKSDVVKTLAEHGADLQCKGAAGDPIIIVAARQDNDMLTTLLEFPSRIDLNHRNRADETALHLTQTTLPNFRRLVNAGADLNPLAQDWGPPITMAATRGDVEKVAYLIQHGADINLGCKNGGPALERASIDANVEVVKLLLEHNVDLDHVSESKSGTALTAACLMRPSSGGPAQALEIIRPILEKGADVNRGGGIFGWHPLTAAAYHMTPEVITTLLEAGAKLDVKDAMGRSPLHLAAFSGATNLQALLDAGADSGAVDATGRTILHYAVAAGRAKSVEMILTRFPGKFVNTPDIDGWTPLCWAARDPDSYMLDDIEDGEPADQVQVIRLLLQNGADRLVVARLGDQKWTPLKIARFSCATEEVLSLLEKGLDGEGTTPAGEEYESKKGESDKGYCDACLLNTYGFAYRCRYCYDFDYCFKCYPHRALYHPSDHEWYPRGLEFEGTEAEESGGEDSDDSKSSTTDSDDSDEEE